MRRLLLAVVLVPLLVSTRAEALVGVEAGTSVPLSMDVRARVDLPLGFFAQGGVGWLPGPYVDLINALADAFDVYSSPTTELIRESLADSLLLEAQLGWNPGDAGGFWFAVTYGYLTLGAGVSARTLVESAIGVTIPPAIPDLNIPLTSNVHMLGGVAGWRFEVAPFVTFGLELALRFPVSSTSRIDTNVSGPIVERVQQRVDAFFDEAFEGLPIPTVGAYVGVSF